ncbi:hypothetical protein JK358_12300 [Nocardia sp. 2]|uniref:WXG100 family type VII secretion target n=1 Tax=Nocardia acididurans TaxID=2802282 RepID=A0ABS1M7P5_9NOCA|nr:hypothetical protein [Nocardia acididurans]MBL1075173.1 hypothetical protein [Nocardia acididurans]
MLYDERTMRELVSNLRQYHTDLVSAAGDGTTNNETTSAFGAASAKLKDAWTNEVTGEQNSSWNSFDAVKVRWNGEYSDTLTTLTRVANEVENAINNALSTDGRVAGGFGG